MKRSLCAAAQEAAPALEIRGDGRCAEFYIYDVYLALGMTMHAGVAGATRFWWREGFYALWHDRSHAPFDNVRAQSRQITC